MLSFLLLSLAAGLLSAAVLIALALVVWRRYFGRRPAHQAPAPPDPFVLAEIDLEANRWAQARGTPEAAVVMAGKLRLLYDLARRRGEA